MIDPSKPGEVLRGWLAIAEFIEVSEKTARRWSKWGRENRLPVAEDHVGPIARVSDLERWKADQLLPYGIRDRLRLRERPQSPSLSQAAENGRETKAIDA